MVSLRSTRMNMRAALLIGLVLAGVVAVALFSPWATLLPAAAAGRWLATRRRNAE